MADITKTVEIIFGAKSDVARVTRAIEQDFDNLTAPLAKAGSAVAKLDAALVALAIGGLALAIRTAGDFNGQFGEITTLLSDTGAPISKFKADIKGYATESTKSIAEINAAIYTSISAGVDYKESLAFLEIAERLSVAGRSALGDTTKVLISVLNAYGEETNQAGKYSDLMFQTVKSGLTTMTELSASLAQVTGLAANAGIPFETLAAAIAALTVTGMPTSQAITSLKAAIQNIIKPTKDAEETAAALGLQFNAAALKTRGLEGVLWAAQKATGGNVETMAKLFGSVEALNAVMVLGTDRTGKFRDTLKEMGTAAGVTQTAYDKVVDEFKNINQRLLNSFQITLGEIGEKIMPAYAQTARGLATMFTGIKIGIDKGAFDSFFAVLDEAGKNIGVWISLVGKAFPEALKQLDLTGLIRAFKELADAIAEFSGASNLADPKRLADAMQFVVDTMESLIDVTKGMGEAFAPFFNAVEEMIRAFNRLDPATKDTIGNLLGFSMIFKMFGPFGLIMMALGTDSQMMAKMFDVSFSSIENGFNAIKVAVLALAVVFAHASQGMAELLDYIPGLNMSEDLKRTGDRVKLLDEMLVKANSDLVLSSDKVKSAFLGTGDAVMKTKSKADEYQKTLGNIPGNVVTEVDLRHEAAHRAAEAVKSTIAEIPGYKEVFFEVDIEAWEKKMAALDKSLADRLSGKNTVEVEVEWDKDGNTIERFDGWIRKISESGTVWLIPTEIDPMKLDIATEKIGAAVKSIEWGPDGTTIEKVAGMIKQSFPDGQTLYTNVGVKIDEAKFNSVVNTLDKAIPTKKEIDVEMKMNLEKIKENSAIVQKSIEWRAKLDIAQVEAAGKIAEGVVKNLGEAIKSTGDLMGDLVKSLTDTTDWGKESKISGLIEKEEKRRQDAFDQQKKLTDAQIENMKARTDAMKNGQGLIQIDGAGLQPHLEAFMFEILKAIQVRANAEGAAFLTGI